MPRSSLLRSLSLLALRVTATRANHSIDVCFGCAEHIGELQAPQTLRVPGDPEAVPAVLDSQKPQVLRFLRILDTLLAILDTRALVAYSFQPQALLGDVVFDIEAVLLD